MNKKTISSEAFYKLPKFLFSDPSYSNLSCEAKILYSIMLDFTHFSTTNGWVDSNGDKYIVYSQQSAQKKLNIGKNKCGSVYKELITANLIKIKKRGQGKPSLIYINPISVEDSPHSVPQKGVQTPENQTSRILKKGIQEVPQSNPNNNNKYNNNNFNNHSIFPNTNEFQNRESENDDFIKCLYEQIGYSRITSEDYEKNDLDLLMSVLVEFYLSNQESFKINGIEISRESVISKIENIDYEVACYILDELKKAKAKTFIVNPKNYIRSCVYNAAQIFEFKIDNQFALDFGN